MHLPEHALDYLRERLDRVRLTRAKYAKALDAARDGDLVPLAAVARRRSPDWLVY
ncbi:hypothetical protein [Embleya sp. NPDC059237]|uniref:hypothetical protein n=1 Tax=Embleya sp. NPDC059237 TaxID=3346784 RepID=UPI00369ACB93